jgi:hypothetical protein
VARLRSAAATSAACRRSAWTGGAASTGGLPGAVGDAAPEPG